MAYKKTQCSVGGGFHTDSLLPTVGSQELQGQWSRQTSLDVGTKTKT